MVERRNTRQRQLVLDAVRGRCDHPTAEQIFTAVHERDEHVSKGTVYRNLHLLAEAGDILAVRVPGGERFDLRTDDHGHMLCVSCGQVVDVAVPLDSSLEERAARETGYTVSTHYMVFEGLCPACQN